MYASSNVNIVYDDIQRYQGENTPVYYFLSISYRSIKILL